MFARLLPSACRHWCARRLVLVALLSLTSGPLRAQMAVAEQIPTFKTIFGLAPEQKSKDFRVEEIACTAPGNVLWPGEAIELSVRITNLSKAPLPLAGHFDVVHYGTRGQPDNVWVPIFFKFADLAAVPMPADVTVEPGKSAVVTVAPTLPAACGAFAVVADFGDHGRAFVATFVRTVKPDDGKVQFPTYALDLTGDPAATATVFQRIGVHGARQELGYVPTTAKNFEQYFTDLANRLKVYEDHGITVMLTLGGGGPQPLNRNRPHLDEHDVMLDTKSDMAWLPESDDDFQIFTRKIVSGFGWPKGPVNAVELWNEPWEGLSISGWGADMLRYREIYTRMAQAVVAARAEDQVQVLIGGACSSTNTLDKLFPDGKDTFLPWLDFVSIHYQPLAAVPALVPQWVNRQGPYGGVRTWDTESWIANTEDRVGAVIASMRAQGQSRTAGVYHQNVYNIQAVQVDQEKTRRQIAQVWSPAVAIAATQKFIGQRAFREVLWKNGLPWVFVFDGLPAAGDASAKPNPDDLSVVVVGDLGAVYDRDHVLFRTVLGLSNAAKVAAAKAALAALPADADKKERAAREAAIVSAAIFNDGTMTVANPGQHVLAFDFYGNAQPAAADGQIVVPLNGNGYFLRTDGSAGSGAALLAAIRAARIAGLQPVELVAHDLLGPPSSQPALRLTLTNVLNRTVAGTLTAQLAELTLSAPAAPITLAPGETKELTCAITAGADRPDNTYALTATFDAGADGSVTRTENLHANLIARRTIKVDGDLSDWEGALPQVIVAGGNIGPSLTEKAWLPMVKYDETHAAGLTTAYLAADEQNFYFAAKIADSTPYDGSTRFETRDDSAYFYPALVHELDRQKTINQREIPWTNDNIKLGALQLPGGAADARCNRAWECGTAALGFDLDLPAAGPKQLALYFLDYDALARRSVHVEIRDRDSGKVLDKRDLKQFGEGQYAVWVVQGKLRVVISTPGWLKATYSAAFLDEAALNGMPAAGNTALFQRLDETTHGAWMATYGKLGYVLPGVPAKLPADATFTVIDHIEQTDLTWPEGVRRFSYRKRPDLPSGMGSDNVQLAFNVVPLDHKPWLLNPAGTMPRFMCYWDTDYEFALNPVAEKFGGGTEVFRLMAPPMGGLRKHFFPRQPAAPNDGGPVKTAQCTWRREGNMRLVEAALPWSELPLVKARLDAGLPIKFTFRVNDNQGPSYELAGDRSVSKVNMLTFHNDWATHWANEVEFVLAK